LFFFFLHFKPTQIEIETTQNILSNLESSKIQIQLLVYYIFCVRFTEEVSLERYNTNETWVQSQKTLTPLSTQNLKAMMRLWALILIWCSTFLFLLNVGLRLPLGFPTFCTISITWLPIVPNRTSIIVDNSRYCIPNGLMWFKLINLLLIKGKNTKTFVV